MTTYAIGLGYHFVSFLLQELTLGQRNTIRSILLFGSVARVAESSSSDIDIFIDTTNSRLKRMATLTLDRFYQSEQFRRYWKLLGVQHEIKVIVDEIKHWPNLRESIISDGITMYGKYTEPIERENPSILIWWDPIKDQTKRVWLSKLLYGWKKNQKTIPGLVEKGQKIGPNTILIPLQKANQVTGAFKKLSVPFRQKLISKIE